MTITVMFCFLFRSVTKCSITLGLVTLIFFISNISFLISQSGQESVCTVVSFTFPYINRSFLQYLYICAKLLCEIIDNAESYCIFIGNNKSKSFFAPLYVIK